MYALHDLEDPEALSSGQLQTATGVWWPASSLPGGVIALRWKSMFLQSVNLYGLRSVETVCGEC